MGGGIDTNAMKVAKTAQATTLEDESVKTAGESVRRRIAAANSRMQANSYWTAMANTPAQAGQKKTTLG